VTIQEELIHRMFLIIDARRWDSLDEVFTPDIVYHRPGYSCIAGIDSLKKFYSEVRMISSGQHVIYATLADSKRGSSWGRFQGQVKSNETIMEDFAEWYEFNGAAISVRRTFFYEPAL
jgi:uncharacterized protein